MNNLKMTKIIKDLYVKLSLEELAEVINNTEAVNEFIEQISKTKKLSKKTFK